MTGWNEHGHAVKTGLPVDKHLGRGDLQDAENCGYAPVSVLAELGVDRAHGDPQVQYRGGRIVLTDGTVLERGGTLNCVWAVTGLPRYTEADVESLAAVLHDARDKGIQYGNYTLARWVLDRWAVDREREAYARGVSEGLRRADNAINWQTSCLGCADRLDGLYAERCRGHEEGLAEGQAERDQLRRLHEATEAALEQAEQYARDLQDNLAIVDSQPTEGWGREWGIRSGATTIKARDRDEAVTWTADSSYTFISRLVGPWEPVEQPDPITPEVYAEFFPERDDAGEPTAAEQPEGGAR